MKEDTRKGNNVQNRFTGYLVSAVRNKRMSYMEKKKSVQEREHSCPDMMMSGHTDFEKEYYRYLLERSARLQGEIRECSELVNILKEKKLIQAILGLKQRDQDMLRMR